MQKNLLIKLAVIVGILLVFLYGIFGFPSSLSGDGLREAVLKRIHLGLDLKGGTHMILQVQVDEAEHFMVLAVVNRPEGALVLLGDCLWERRDFWDQELLQVINSLKAR